MPELLICNRQIEIVAAEAETAQNRPEMA